jgi:hypothetical protein
MKKNTAKDDAQTQFYLAKKYYFGEDTPIDKP